MKCEKCQVPLTALGLSVLKINLGFCPKCGLVYAKAGDTQGPAGSAPAPGKTVAGRQQIPPGGDYRTGRYSK